MNCDTTTSAGVLVNIDTQAYELHTLAERIKERDRQLEACAKSHWLQNGCDLLAAKTLTGHGKFKIWCTRELEYSIRTAEKLMRAAEMFRPLIKGESDSFLLSPSLAYALSAPSLPPSIRDDFLPQALGGEQIGPQLRKAVKKHAQAAISEPRRALDEHVRDEQGDHFAHACTSGNDQTASAEVQDEQHAARSAALGLIVERLGDQITEFLALVTKAGAGEILSLASERELQEAASGTATRPVAAAVGQGPDEVIAEGSPLDCTGADDAPLLAEPTGAVGGITTVKAANKPSVTAVFRSADFGSGLKRTALPRHTPCFGGSADQTSKLPTSPSSTLTGLTERLF